MPLSKSSLPREPLSGCPYTAELAAARETLSAAVSQALSSSSTLARRRGPGVVLRTRLIVCAVLAVPVIAMAMIPALQFDGWQWVSLALATPVVGWGAWPIHRAAWKYAYQSMNSWSAIGSSFDLASGLPPMESWKRERRPLMLRFSPASRCPSTLRLATLWPGRRSMPEAVKLCGPRGSVPTRRWPVLVASLKDAQSGKAQVQRLADRVAAVFVPMVIALKCVRRVQRFASPPFSVRE